MRVLASSICTELLPEWLCCRRPSKSRCASGLWQGPESCGIQWGYTAGLSCWLTRSIRQHLCWPCQASVRFVRVAVVMQDSLLRSLLKGVVWRVFSTALTVSIILAVFRDTVQVSIKLAGLLGSAAPL